MRGFLVAYSEHEQHVHIANQDYGKRGAAKRRDLVDWATERMVADVIYDGNIWVGMSGEGLVLYQG